MPEFTPAVGEVGLAKHPQMEEIFQKALAGELPRNRPLKPWEPEKLNATHLQVIMLRATGMRQRKIAEFMNNTQFTTLNDQQISVICNHPDARYILARMVGYAADNITDIRTRMTAYASEGLDRTVEIMRTSNDHKLVSKISFEFLDRAGYNTVQKVEADVRHTVAIEAGAANNLAEALRESRNEIEADFTMTGQEVLMGEGSGNSLVSSESQVGNLPAGVASVASVPPTDASSHPKLRLTPDMEPEDIAILKEKSA